MQALFEHHQAKNAKATILTAIAENPTGYGRILRGSNGQVEQIVEQRMLQQKRQLVKK